MPPLPLTNIMNVRLTRPQYELLRQLGEDLGRPPSPVLREVLMLWALQHAKGKALDYDAMVAELRERFEARDDALVGDLVEHRAR